MMASMSDPEFKLDVQTPSAAISEIAEGMSDLRDALEAMANLAAGDGSVSELAPCLRQAWSGAAAVSMVCALVGPMDWAGQRCGPASHPTAYRLAARSVRAPLQTVPAAVQAQRRPAPPAT
jgi:hypothetical protein